MLEIIKKVLNVIGSLLIALSLPALCACVIFFNVIPNIILATVLTISIGLFAYMLLFLTDKE